MAENNQNTQSNQPQQFVCTGDCKKCRSMQQWSYCASIHAYSNMKVLDKMMEVLGKMQEDMATMQGIVQEMAAKIESIQNSEATVFDPNCEGEPFPKEFAKKDDKKENAQEEDGAENRSSQK